MQNVTCYYLKSLGIIQHPTGQREQHIFFISLYRFLDHEIEFSD